MKSMVFMMAVIVMVAASDEDEASLSWKKVAEPGPILEPRLIGKFWSNSVPDFVVPRLEEPGM